MNFLTKISYFFLLFLAFSTGSYGQLNISEFLSTAAQEQELSIYQSQISYLKKNPYRMSPVRELEFRTQTNEIGANEQRYGLRVSAANPWEIRNTKKVFSTYQSLLSLKKELAFKEILSNRYLLLTELLYLNELQGLKAELVTNLNNQISILERQSSSEFFDAEDYIKLKLSHMEELADLETLNFSLAQRVREIERLQGKGTLELNGLSFDSIISIENLKGVVDSLMREPLYTTRLAYQKEKIKMAEYEYALEKSDINPGFIQAAYRPYNYVENKNPIGINIGIAIPVVNPNKGKMAEHKLDILEAQAELDIEKQLAADELERWLSSLANALERYKNLEKQMSSYDMNKMLAAVNALNKENPSIALQLNARLLKLKSLKLEVKSEIYQTYIHILTKADLLTQRPLVNYFSEELKGF